VGQDDDDFGFEWPDAHARRVQRGCCLFPSADNDGEILLAASLPVLAMTSLRFWGWELGFYILDQRGVE